jgi:hypothetical protein
MNRIQRSIRRDRRDRRLEIVTPVLFRVVLVYGLVSVMVGHFDKVPGVASATALQRPDALSHNVGLFVMYEQQIASHYQ